MRRLDRGGGGNGQRRGLDSGWSRWRDRRMIDVGTHDHRGQGRDGQQRHCERQGSNEVAGVRHQGSSGAAPSAGQGSRGASGDGTKGPGPPGERGETPGGAVPGAGEGSDRASSEGGRWPLACLGHWPGRLRRRVGSAQRLDVGSSQQSTHHGDRNVVGRRTLRKLCRGAVRKGDLRAGRQLSKERCQGKLRLPRGKPAVGTVPSGRRPAARGDGCQEVAGSGR